MGSEIVLKVPYHSQYEGISDEDWKSKGCAIACTKMVLDYFSNNAPSIDSLISEGELVGGFKNGLWDHESIVRILRNHDISAYRQEFRSVIVDVEKEEFIEVEQLVNKGTRKIISELKKDLPIMVSVKEGFGDNNGPHMILITGAKIDENGIPTHLIYHDPDTRNGDRKESIEMEVSKFIDYWRRFAIFVEK